jgi:Sec-independent protein translocase protein TatA
MEVINISGLELLVVAIIALILLGPDGTVKFMKEAGKLIRKIVRSPIWKDVMSTSKEIRSFPDKIVKEANLEEELKEFQAWRAQTKGINQSLSEIEKELNIPPKPINLQPENETVEKKVEQPEDKAE